MENNTITRLLRETLGSRVLLGNSAEYDSARTVWNGMIDRHPIAIVPCRNTDDIQLALKAARENDLCVCIKGGGHNIAGSAVSDGMLMIDLSPMCGVVVDPEQLLAHVEGGATWSMLDAATMEYGLAVPGGIVSSTGVAGLTLGGGIGWLARRYGLTIDHLVSAELVLLDGRCVQATVDEHPDLFWAIRGGSGNFGVVSRFTFRLRMMESQVLFGPTFFSLGDAPRVLEAYGENAGNLPREACVWANLMTAPPVPVLPESVHGTKVLTLMQSFCGDLANARDHLSTLYGGVPPLGDALALRPFTDAQCFLDANYEKGARNYWRSHNHTEITPALIKTLVELAPDLPTPESELLICQLGGSVADVPDDETAFPHRRIPFVSTPGVRWHDHTDDSRVINWLKAASEKIAEHATHGSYVNFIAEREGSADSAYGSNLTRLSQVKQRYDPDNIFRSNQNIQPTEV